jgi:hypothetical protein
MVNVSGYSTESNAQRISLHVGSLEEFINSSSTTSNARTADKPPNQIGTKSNINEVNTHDRVSRLRWMTLKMRTKPIIEQIGIDQKAVPECGGE